MAPIITVVLFIFIFIALLLSVDTKKVWATTIAAAAFAVLYYTLDEKTESAQQVLNNWPAIFVFTLMFADVALLVGLFKLKKAGGYLLHIFPAMLFSQVALFQSSTTDVSHFVLYTGIFFLFFAATAFAGDKLFNVFVAAKGRVINK